MVVNSYFTLSKADSVISGQVLSQQMPAQDGELSRHRDRRNLMAATGSDTQEERAQWARRFGCGPRGLDQHGPGMRTPALADTTMLGQAETGLPHPWVQPDIADQLLRTGKAAHIADCRDQTGGDDQIDTRDREQPLDRRIIASCLCDLRVENSQIRAQPIELPQVPSE